MTIRSRSLPFISAAARCCALGLPLLGAAVANAAALRPADIRVANLLEESGAALTPRVRIDSGGGAQVVEVTLTNETSKEVHLAQSIVDIPWVAPTGAGFQIAAGDTATGRWPVTTIAGPDQGYGSLQSGMYLLAREPDHFDLAGFLTWRTFWTKLTYRPGFLVETADGEGRRVRPGETVALEKVQLAESNDWQGLLYAYAHAVARELGVVRKTARHWVGWSTWDYYGQHWRPDDVTGNIAALKQLVPDANLIQIDGGWWTARGDFSRAREDLGPDGMRRLAETIRGAGFTAGIHLDGMRAAADAEVARRHPEFFLHDELGRLLVERRAAGGDAGDVLFDFSNPAACAYMSDSLRRLRSWGYDYFKIDYLRAGIAEDVRRSAFPKNATTRIAPFDPGLTSVERFHRALAAFREGMGQDAYFLGCSTPFGPALGHVDGLRTGPDISPRFAGYRFDCEANGGNFYLAGDLAQIDADYEVVRGRPDEDVRLVKDPSKDGGNLTQNEGGMWTDYVALFSGTKLASDDLMILRDSRKALVRYALTQPASTRFVPLDFWEHARDSRDAFQVFLGLAGGKVYLAMFNWTDMAQTYALGGLAPASLQPIGPGSDSAQVGSAGAGAGVTLAPRHAAVFRLPEGADFDRLRLAIRVEAERPATTRAREPLVRGWRFHRGDFGLPADIAAPDFDDRDWRIVRVPHDYVIEESYEPPGPNAAPAIDRIARSHAYLPLEPAWYRRRLSIPESARGKVMRLDFDGVFRDSQVWLNGKFLGRHSSGYTPFSFDITADARPGSDNVLAVRVDPRQPEGWWYEGGGIYRDVWLTTLDPMHVALWGTDVTATVPDGDRGADGEAVVTIRTTVENEGSAAEDCGLLSKIFGPQDELVATIRADLGRVAPGSREVSQQVVIPHPELWSTDAPRLYRLSTTVIRAGSPVDGAETTFGIRTLRFDPDKGFFLNGHRVEIKGLACHQDFGGVGIAVPDSLQAWRVAQVKMAGANGWRTAHDPPSESLLDACDRLGVLVMDETRQFSNEGLPDLATMVRRDRNHPSIILWAMGNEGGKRQGTPIGAAMLSTMRGVVQQYDRTRPVTYAMNAGWLAEKGIADAEDVIGVNYHPEAYDAIHRRHSDKMMFGSETTNEKTTRGEYADNPTTGMCSAYALSEQGWQAVATRPFLAGSFTWTAMDYMGEPNPYGWPDCSSNTGLMDRCGFPKDKYYYFQSCWTDRPMVHLVPDSWTWPGKEGRPIRVLAFSNASRVELILNGRSVGTADVPQDGHAEWNVTYEPGRLLARAFSGRKVVATALVETTSAPARIALSADRVTLRADDQDAIVVRASILDDQDRVVPTAANAVFFKLGDGGRMLGVGDGDPADHDPQQSDRCRAFHGRCIAIVQAGDRRATLQLTAASPGLAPARIDLDVR